MIRTLWVWTVGIFMTVLCGSLIVVFSFLDSSGKCLHFFARLWARTIIAASGVRVKVRGERNLPVDSAIIVTSNHQGYFDIFVLMGYLPRHLGWIAKKELYRIPVFSFAMRRYGNIMIDRSNRERARRSLKAAADKIREGQSVLIFPEGTRSPDGKVHAFKKGCYYLAEASGAPIIPVSISGSFEVMPKKTFRLHPGTVHVVIGEPVYVQPSDGADRNGFLDRLRRTIIRNQVC
ncbi:MAG: 1-acyl-sn-glycerol-3-phosphate acyltransferase [Deltaproteobacteria bacterium]|nr:1-acyl-sn-glycerol-3-phosphate acyltransferase [Deltaproteobacteria bacterium]